MSEGVVIAAVTKEFAARGGGHAGARAGGKSTVRALDNVSFTAKRGAITGLVGPDGAGKTTLLRIAAGLLAADSGTVRNVGLDPIAQSDELRQRIGYMPQKFGLYEDLGVRENLELYADLQGVSHADREPRYDRLLKMTGLAPFLDRLAGDLSGGMKQKLGLACALIKSPEMLLLDEPTVGVDPVSRRELWRIVRELLMSGDLGVLVATSYFDEAARCDEVVLLDGGHLLDVGPPARFSAAMAGRVFELTPARDVPPRRLQVALADAPGVVDATIRSGRVRIVVAETGADVAAPLRDVDAASRRAAPPDFGDAFMARLAARRQAVAVPTFARRRDAPASAAGGGDVVVRVRELCKRFGGFDAVRGVGFEVRRGEIFGLLGPNGAGKSTTFRMLCGLTSITSGEATVAGADLRRAGRRGRARLGYMAQKFSLYGTLSVVQNLRFFGTAYGLAGRPLRERIDVALDAFGLTARRDESAGALPTGFKQRLAMAAALLHDPEILFLDEPTSGVDPIARREFWRRINATALTGTTVVVTTHFMEEAEYCDRMLIMARGRELAMGTPAEIRALVRSAELPDPTIEDAFVVLAERQEAAAA